MTSTLSPTPVFDYTSRDYQSILNDLIARKPVYMPTWTSTSNNDFGIVLLQMYAYMGDQLGYYLDRLSAEAFFQTATQADSIINLAAMLDYTPKLSISSQVTLTVTISQTLSSYPVDIPAGSQFSTMGSQSQQPIIFTTIEDLSIPGTSVATPQYVGTVTATQGVVFNQNVATSDGTVNQIYSFTQTPVSANSFSVFVDIGLGPQEWVYAQTLIDSGPSDLVYTNYVDANGIFYIVFGDGVNGLVPPLGSPITAMYQTNVGSTGNVGASTITVPVSAVVGLISVTNSSPATGGAAAESIASIQVNAPASLRALNRGVTVNDISTLAQSVTGVQWASAVEQTYQLVNLYIAPSGGGIPSSVLTASVQSFIDSVVMANTTVTVLSPTYVPVNISVQVFAFSNFANSTVQQNVVNALTALLQLTNTGFGARISLGTVYETVLSVAGVNYCFVTVLGRQFMVMLTQQLIINDVYTSLSTSPLPQAVNPGDQLALAAGTATVSTQIISTTAGASTSSTMITVQSFTANATYPIGSSVQDVTLLTDVVTLPSEVPVLGTITVTVTGGNAE